MFNVLLAVNWSQEAELIEFIDKRFIDQNLVIDKIYCILKSFNLTFSLSKNGRCLQWILLETIVKCRSPDHFSWIYLICTVSVKLFYSASNDVLPDHCHRENWKWYHEGRSHCSCILLESSRKKIQLYISRHFFKIFMLKIIKCLIYKQEIQPVF